MVKSPDERRREQAVAGFIAELRTSYLYCRELGHTWKPWRASLNHERTAYERVLRCSRCRTERVQELSLSGHVVSGHYIYPDGYTSAGLGRLIGDDRDALRIASVTRSLTTED